MDTNRAINYQRRSSIAATYARWDATLAYDRKNNGYCPVKMEAEAIGWQEYAAEESAAARRAMGLEDDQWEPSR